MRPLPHRPRLNAAKQQTSPPIGAKAPPPRLEAITRLALRADLSHPEPRSATASLRSYPAINSRALTAAALAPQRLSLRSATRTTHMHQG